jgi:hypothetical protein
MNQILIDHELAYKLINCLVSGGPIGIVTNIWIGLPGYMAGCILKSILVYIRFLTAW